MRKEIRSVKTGLKEDIKPITTVLVDLAKYVIIAVIGALLALVLNHK